MHTLLEILLKPLSRENCACHMRALCSYTHDFTIADNVIYTINRNADPLDKNAIY